MTTLRSTTGLLALTLILSGCATTPPPQPTASGASLSAASSSPAPTDQGTSSSVASAAAEESDQETASAPTGLQVGQTFRIVLKSNATTGYAWVPTFDEKILTKLTDTYVAPRPVRVTVGAAGRQIFSFRAIAPGTTKLTFDYVRSWEKGVAPVETRTFDITVR